MADVDSVKRRPYEPTGLPEGQSVGPSLPGVEGRGALRGRAMILL